MQRREQPQARCTGGCSSEQILAGGSPPELFTDFSDSASAVRSRGPPDDWQTSRAGGPCEIGDHPCYVMEFLYHRMFGEELLYPLRSENPALPLALRYEVRGGWRASEECFGTSDVHL